MCAVEVEVLLSMLFWCCSVFCDSVRESRPYDVSDGICVVRESEGRMPLRGCYRIRGDSGLETSLGCFVADGAVSPRPNMSNLLECVLCRECTCGY